MGLGHGAYTTASHVLLIYGTVCLIDALIRSHGRSSMADPLVSRAAFAVAAMAVVERAYYVTARVLLPSGVNLWQAHPAPGMLSFALACAVLWLAGVIVPKGMRQRTIYCRWEGWAGALTLTGALAVWLS